MTCTLMQSRRMATNPDGPTSAMTAPAPADYSYCSLSDRTQFTLSRLTQLLQCLILTTMELPWDYHLKRKVLRAILQDPKIGRCQGRRRFTPQRVESVPDEVTVAMRKPAESPICN